MEKRFCLIDDSVTSLGGTALTLNAIIEPNKEKVDTVATEFFRFNQDDNYFYIIGNCMTLSQESFESLYYMTQKADFCKIEFDYNYCRYRGPVAHKKFEGEECSCPFGSSGYLPIQQLYKNICSNAKKIFYMSDEQRDVHLKALPMLDKSKTVRLSSTFLEENYKKIREYRPRAKNGKYAVIEGQGGWHTEAKGIKESIEYAHQNNLDYDLISTKTHEEMLDLLSQYSGLIFLPIQYDTCPRVTIEAKLLGLDVITNENSQHINEEWWDYGLDKMEEYLINRPHFFWKTLNELQI